MVRKLIDDYVISLEFDLRIPPTQPPEMPAHSEAGGQQQPLHNGTGRIQRPEAVRRHRGAGGLIQQEITIPRLLAQPHARHAGLYASARAGLPSME